MDLWAPPSMKRLAPVFSHFMITRKKKRMPHICWQKRTRITIFDKWSWLWARLYARTPSTINSSSYWYFLFCLLVFFKLVLPSAVVPFQASIWSLPLNLSVSLSPLATWWSLAVWWRLLFLYPPPTIADHSLMEFLPLTGIHTVVFYVFLQDLLIFSSCSFSFFCLYFIRLVGQDGDDAGKLFQRWHISTCMFQWPTEHFTCSFLFILLTFGLMLFLYTRTHTHTLWLIFACCLLCSRECS